MKTPPKTQKLPTKGELMTWLHEHSAYVDKTLKNLRAELDAGRLTEALYNQVDEALLHAAAVGHLQSDLLEDRYRAR